MAVYDVPTGIFNMELFKSGVLSIKGNGDNCDVRTSVSGGNIYWAGSSTDGYYIYELNVKLDRDQLNELLGKLKSTEVKIILDAEAAKFCKKKYDKSLDEILDHVIAIG
jgi:hypothetical protein